MGTLATRGFTLPIPSKWSSEMCMINGKAGRQMIVKIWYFLIAWNNRMSDGTPT